MPNLEMPNNAGRKSEAEIEVEIEERRKRKIALTKELNESQESIPFPGIDSEGYQKLKAFEEEFPDFATPIDELVKRFKDEGIKVVFGEYPESGNVLILPFGSDDAENDSIPPEHLQVSENMDSRLKELVLTSRR